MWRIKPQLLMRATLWLVMNERLGEALFPPQVSKALLRPHCNHSLKSVRVRQTQINKFQR